MPVEALPWILFLLGIGFLVVNVRTAGDLVRWRRRRPSAVIVWQGAKPPLYGLSLGIGVMLGLLLFVSVAAGAQQGRALFGLAMMFIYYGYLLPLTTRIGRGLYADGIWTDSAFLPYTHIGGISWKQEDPGTLVVVSRLGSLARRLHVPGHRLGEVRRYLREKIASHTIEMDLGPGLHLGERDTRESV